MVRWRINFILVSLFLLGMVLIGRLFYIQIIKADFYQALAQGLYSSDRQIIGERGEIFFRNGEPLAVNIDWFLVFSSPIEIKEKEIVAGKLAEILALKGEDKSSSPFATVETAKDFILEKLEKNNLYEPIKNRITDEEIQKIKELNLKGIYLDREKGRYYPQGAFASQLVGFVGADQQGQYGLEGYEDEILRAKKGQRSGEDIFLTVDYSIQFRAEKLLEQAKENLDIEGGEIIVINPNSGEILALANLPNFNPNQYSTVSDFKIFKNAATQKIFEPGSVFKPITMAAALNEGKITPQTTYLDPGAMEFDGWPIYNYERRIYRGETTPEITMTEVLEKSINTGAVFAEQRLGRELFFQYIGKFEFFEKTGINLQETVPENKELYEARQRGREINFVTAAYGQGIEMTPIQLIRAYSAIANGGKLVRPFLVKKIVKGDEVLEVAPEIEEDLVISPKTAAQLTAMLVSVVENGFAKSARIPGYWVAGKTGTAQMSFAALEINQKGYSDKTWQSFAGFVPAFNPEFLILVKLNNPKTKTAEYLAVPIFQDLAKYIVDYCQIPPDYE